MSQKDSLKLPKLSSIIFKILGPPTEGLASLLDFWGFVCQSRMNYKQAEKILFLSLKMRAFILGSQHPSYANSLKHLGLLYQELGKYSQSEELLLQALKILQLLPEIKSASYANVLSGLALTYCYAGRYDESLSLSLEAKQIRYEILGPLHSDYALSLNDLGLLYFITGQFVEAEQLFADALEIWDKTVGKSDSDFANTLTNLACVYKATGRYNETEQALKESLSITGKVLSKNHIRYAGMMNHLGLLYQSMGRFSEAESLHEDALECQQRALGVKHPLYATSLNNLALLYYYAGRYEESEFSYIKARQICEQFLGVKHPLYARILNNLSMLYCTANRPNEAFKAAQQAVAVFKTALGAWHPEYGIALNNLAYTHIIQAHYDEALGLLLKSLDVLENSGEFRYCAASLNNMALIYLEVNHNQEALNLFEQARDVLEMINNENHPDYALVLANLGYLYSNIGDWTQAEYYLVKSIEIRQHIKSLDNMDYSISLQNLGIVMAKTGRYTEAVNYLEQSLEIGNRLLYRLSAAWAESAALKFNRQIKDAISVLLSLVCLRFQNDSATVIVAFNQVLKNKGIVFESAAARHQLLLAQRYPDLEDKIRNLNLLRSNLARYCTVGSGPSPIIQDNQIEIEPMLEQFMELERELIQQIPQEDIRMRMFMADRHTIASKLADNAALLEYALYSACRFHTDNSDLFWDEDRYAVFILPSGSADKISLIDLGPAASINTFIAQFSRDLLQSAQDPQVCENVKRCSRDLYDHLLKPVIMTMKENKELSGINHFIIAPDGDIYHIPFDALLSCTGKFAIEEYTFSYVSTGRELVNLDRYNGNNDIALILSDPFYDLKSSKVESKAENRTTSRNYSLKDELHKGYWPFSRLIGTRREGFVINEILKRRYKDTRYYYGHDSLKNRLHTVTSPAILHLATHGFFICNSEETKSDSGFVPPFGIHDSTLNTINPLLRGGLALAGANSFLEGLALPPEAEDGILSALDVLNLDLTGTELVVLSACESGRGVVLAGEGISGLRRAFFSAGAKSLVVSLWNIPDEQTRILMEYFYKHLLDGETRAGSLHRAQLGLLEYERAKSGQQDYVSPILWAGFVCLGNPGPLSNDYSK